LVVEDPCHADFPGGEPLWPTRTNRTARPSRHEAMTLQRPTLPLPEVYWGAAVPSSPVLTMRSHQFQLTVRRASPDRHALAGDRIGSRGPAGPTLGGMHVARAHR
jgi:hypothetical protein